MRLRINPLLPILELRKPVFDNHNAVGLGLDCADRPMFPRGYYFPMRRKVLILACIMFCHAHASAEVPQRYIGTWVVDVEATSQAIANDPTLVDKARNDWKPADYVL